MYIEGDIVSCFLIVITVIVIDPVVNYSLFLYKAKELDVDQGCVSRGESQVKIQEF